MKTGQKVCGSSFSLVVVLVQMGASMVRWGWWWVITRGLNLFNHEFSGAHGAIVPTLGLKVQGYEAEVPTALYVHSLDHPSAVRTRPRCCLPWHLSFILSTHKHQTHLPLLPFFSLLSLCLLVNNSWLCLACFALLYRERGSWSEVKKQLY